MNTNKKRSLIWKVSREKLIEIIEESNSFTEALSHFNLQNKGSNHITLKARLDYENISYIKFYNRRSKKYTSHNKKEMAEILTENSKYGRSYLKIRLVSENLIEYKCSKCGLGDTWNGDSIKLSLDHINGISNDNRLENLRFLCPNCHSQTENFAGKNKKTVESNKNVVAKQLLLPFEVPSKRNNKSNGNSQEKRSVSNVKKLCSICKIEVKNKDRNYCPKCAAKKRRKVERPTKEELEKLVWEIPTLKLAEEYGVSDKAIAKWCKTYNIEKPPRGYWGFK